MDRTKEEAERDPEKTTTENEVVAARDQIMIGETALGLLGLR